MGLLIFMIYFQGVTKNRVSVRFRVRDTDWCQGGGNGKYEKADNPAPGNIATMIVYFRQAIISGAYFCKTEI